MSYSLVVTTGTVVERFLRIRPEHRILTHVHVLPGQRLEAGDNTRQQTRHDRRYDKAKERTKEKVEKIPDGRVRGS